MTDIEIIKEARQMVEYSELLNKSANKLLLALIDRKAERGVELADEQTKLKYLLFRAKQEVAKTILLLL